MGHGLGPAAQDYAERDGLHGSTLALGPLARPDPSELGGAIRRTGRVERDAHVDGQRGLVHLAGSYLLLAPTARPRMRSTPAYETAAFTNQQHSPDAPSELTALLLPDRCGHAATTTSSIRSVAEGVVPFEIAQIAKESSAT
jgi:hypothetical protein